MNNGIVFFIDFSVMLEYNVVCVNFEVEKYMDVVWLVQMEVVCN